MFCDALAPFAERRNIIMINIEELKFDEKGLIPAIVTDAESKRC